MTPAGRPSRDVLAVYDENAEIPTWDYPYRSDRKWCDRTGLEHFYHCPGGAHGWYRSRVPCVQLDCWTCYDLVKKRRGRKKFLQLGGAHLGAFVFTFPTAWASRLGYRQLRDARRRLAAILKRWAFELWGGQVGFYTAFHPQGDRCSRCGHVGDDSRLSQCDKCRAPLPWKPHFHVGMPLVTLVEGRLVELNFMRTEDDLDSLKGLWGDFLAELACRWGDDIPATNVHYAFRTETLRIRHRITYDCRPFPSWSAGTMPLGLASPICYGLASPGMTGEAVERWRQRVRGTLEEEGNQCPVEDCPHDLDHVGTIKRWSADHDLWSPQAVLLDELGEAVPGTGPPDNPCYIELPEPTDRWWQN